MLSPWGLIHLGFMSLLKSKRTDILDWRVQTDEVIKALQVLENGAPGLGSALEAHAIGTFLGQGGSIPAGGGATHAHFNAQLTQGRQISLTLILRPAIRVMQQVRSRTAQ